MTVERLPQVEVALVHGSFDRSAIGKFSYTTLAAAHEMERDMVSEKMRDAVHYSAAQGEMVGQVPIGYRRAKDFTVTVDEEPAAVVRRLFDMYATGRYGVRSLARILNAEGVRLPSLPDGWRGDTVAQILGNMAYLGKTYAEKRRHQQGKLIGGKWEPIIDQDTWDKVQRQRQIRRTSTGPSRTSGARSYVFQKLVRCTNCGLRMHAQTIDGHAYYRCDRSEGRKPCRALVREDRLLPWAESLIHRLDAYEPEGLGAKVDVLVGIPPPPEALADIDAELERIGWRFDKGYLGQKEQDR